MVLIFVRFLVRVDRLSFEALVVVVIVSIILAYILFVLILIPIR